jgi:hypothetical protein
MQQTGSDVYKNAARQFWMSKPDGAAEVGRAILTVMLVCGEALVL